MTLESPKCGNISSKNATVNTPSTIHSRVLVIVIFIFMFFILLLLYTIPSPSCLDFCSFHLTWRLFANAILCPSGRILFQLGRSSAVLAFCNQLLVIKYGRRVCAHFQWEEQQFELIEWLESAGYLTANFTATRQGNGEISPGIVWAHPDYIVVLRQRGHLTLMASTHQTNWLGWFLYTLLVRDECGSWRPCGHMLAQKEDGDILAAGLQCLKQWAGGLDEIRGWRLRYMLTDDSPAEQRAVKLPFGGLNTGKREVTHLLCVFHSHFKAKTWWTCM